VPDTRSAAVIGQCLRALAQAMPEIPAEVIIVDNASADDTVAVARNAAPEARIIEQDHNGGFAQGCAAGASAAAGRWLLFLNPDTVIAAEAIKALLACARSNPSAGVIGGRFVHEDGTIDPRSWWGKPTPWSALCFALGLNSVLAGSKIFDRETPRPWAPGLREVRAAPVVVLAEHNLGLVRVKPEADLLHPRLKRRPHLQGLPLGHAVHHRVVRIALEFHCRELLLQPGVERVMHEQVR